MRPLRGIHAADHLTLKAYPIGYFICHFGSGQRSPSSRTPCALWSLRAVGMQTGGNIVRLLE
ncbi:MAG: hypothetical protein N6V49_06815 [Serratia symbiotica]|nr:hypothetical protein [Serratia symbiotica]